MTPIADGSFYIQESNQDFWLRENGQWVRKGNIRDEGASGIVTVSSVTALGYDMSAQVDLIRMIESTLHDLGLDMEVELNRIRDVAMAAGLGFAMEAAVQRHRMLAAAKGYGFNMTTLLTHVDANVEFIAAAMTEGFSMAVVLQMTRLIASSQGMGFTQASPLLMRIRNLSASNGFGFGQAAALQRIRLLTAAKAFGFAQSVVLTHAATAPGLLVVAHATTPFMTVYDSSLVKLTKTWTTPQGNLSHVAISNDKRWIAVGGAVSPYLEIFDCNSGVPVLVTGVTFSGLTACRGLAFTKDSTKLLVADVTSPYLYCYSTSGWGVAGGVTLPTLSAAPSNLTMHPDGTKYVIGYPSSPWMEERTLSSGSTTGTFSGPSALCRGVMYNTVDSATDYLLHIESGPTLRWFNAGTGGVLTNPASPTAGNPNNNQHAVRLNSDGTKALIAGSATAEYRLITRSGTTLSNATLGTVPTDPIRGGVWSKDGTKLIAIVTGANGNFMYSYDATSFVKDTTNANQPAGAGAAIDCSW